MLKYDSTQFVGGGAESDISDCIATQGQGTATISGDTGASATIFRTNISTDYFHIESISGSFVNGETLTITKEDLQHSKLKREHHLEIVQVKQDKLVIAVDSSDGTLVVQM